MPHRHTHRDRLLPARRHSAVCVAAIGGQLLNARLLSIARRVLQTAGRDKPLDSVLRAELRAEHLTPSEAATVSRTLYAHERWRGWLTQARRLPERLELASSLAQRFAEKPESFPDEEILARALPAWLAREMKVEGVWARSLQTEPKVWLRARPGQGGALAQKLGHCRAFGPEPPLSDILEYQGARNLFRTPELQAGEFEVQDLNSQAVSLVCAPQPGQTWWDACAGEGGKLLHLSDLMGNRGLIWASDRATWRLKKLKTRAARARVFNYRSAPWDGSSKLPTRTRFDGVLLDAPCSGVGTWHRNPHARWTTSPQDVRELAQVQRDLLVRSAAAVKPGGKLIYSVCTMTRAETDEIVEAFEAQCGDFEPLPFGNPLDPKAPSRSRLWLWTQDHGGNGMFIAAWRRKL